MTDEKPSWWDLYGKPLREPFPASMIDSLPKAGRQLSYVGHAAVTDRLLKVDPFWSWEPMSQDEHGLPRILTDPKRGVAVLWARLTVGGFTRPAVGTARLDKEDLEKELISDMLRNGAMRFGVALDLWSKADLDGSEPVADHMKQPSKRNTPSKDPAWPSVISELLANDPTGWHDALDRIRTVFAAMADAGLWGAHALDAALEGKPIEDALDDLEPALAFWEKTKSAAQRDLAGAA